MQTKKRKTPVKDTRRPNYYALKGTIDLETLKAKFENDLFNNMNLADKMGVFHVLRDLHFDAKQKMQWLERRRHENRLGKQDEPKPQFPGYEDRFLAAEIELKRELQNQ